MRWSRFAPLIVLFLFCLPLLLTNQRNSGPSIEIVPDEQASPSTDIPPSTGIIEAAFRAGTSNLIVRDTGVVDRILADDNVDARHQRFIVRLSSGHTVLVAHNIDLAPRVSNLTIGQPIEFQGEYEWKPEGGVVHWTHHDPNGRHVGGYLRYSGYVFQ
ncbi:MAG: DUF3465 domain-containing protein [Candidatus Hydrogenedentes bacterium]|nr:DUF3465 domain-containing protein [Candidatus Hydrogenedentota bacterium]